MQQFSKNYTEKLDSDLKINLISAIKTIVIKLKPMRGKLQERYWNAQPNFSELFPHQIKG